MLKLKLQFFGHLIQRTDSLEKTLMLGKIEGGKRRGQEDEMVGWHHQLNGYEFEQALGVGDGQRSLVCCSPWGHKESDTTEWLNWTAVVFLGIPSGASGKEPACHCRRCKNCGFNPWVGKMPWRRAWQPSPVFLPGKSHRQRSLAGYSP